MFTLTQKIISFSYLNKTLGFFILAQPLLRLFAKPNAKEFRGGKK
jgi:hypothetical protein